MTSRKAIKNGPLNSLVKSLRKTPITNPQFRQDKDKSSRHASRIIPSIEEQWSAFERWSRRQQRRILESEGDPHVWKYHELVDEYSLSPDDLRQRIASKTKFFQGYLVDVSFDGPEFMHRQGTAVLPFQYPARSKTCYGIWLVVNNLDKADFGSLHFFDSDVSFFLPELDRMDWASIRQVIPFDHAFIRRPEGVSWDRPTMREAANLIRSSLEGEESVKVRWSLSSSELACIEVRA